MSDIAFDKKTGSQQLGIEKSTPSVDAALNTNRSAEQTRDNLQADIRKEIKSAQRKSISADSVQIIPGETVLDPATLKKMFLLGRLTQSQLAHELKKYNYVEADSIIKDGKKNFTAASDFREVGRGSVSNPGGDMRPDQENQSMTKEAPKNAKDAKKVAGSTDNEKLKKELEKKEVKLKQQEQTITNRRLNQFTEMQVEQKNQHASVNLQKRKEELEASKDFNPLDTSIDKASKNAGRPKLSKNLAEEIKEELEKLRSGPGQSSDK